MSRLSSTIRISREHAQAMSRAALSRSRLDKARVVLPPPQAPPVSVDLIPGRFTEADWTSLVEIEEGEDVVGEILDSLLRGIMDECFEVYLARQRIPFTISQARDAMIKIAEWRFLVRDEGELEIAADCTCEWKEDEEPVPCITDSWAQGSVPVIHTGLTPRTEDNQVPFDGPDTTIAQDEIEMNAVTSEEQFAEEPPPPSPEQVPVREVTSKEKTLKPESDVEKKLKSPRKSQALLRQPAPPPKEGKPRREYRPHRGLLRSAGLKNITKSLEDTEKEMLLQQLSQTLPKKENDKGLGNSKLLPTSFQNILKIQLNRPTNNKDVLYDESGRVISVPKLDPARLPKRRIKPQVEVVDVEAEYNLTEVIRKQGSAVAQQALKSVPSEAEKESRRRKLDLGKNVNFELIKYTNSTAKPISTSRTVNTMEDQLRSGKPLDLKRPIALKAGVLLESMKLSHGVILKEPGSTDQNFWRGAYPQKNEDTIKEEELKPIRTTMPFPKVSVDQLLKNHVPRVRQIASLPPFAPSLRGQS